jgi:hypothetical protein
MLITNSQMILVAPLRTTHWESLSYCSQETMHLNRVELQGLLPHIALWLYGPKANDCQIWECHLQIKLKLFSSCKNRITFFSKGRLWKNYKMHISFTYFPFLQHRALQIGNYLFTILNKSRRYRSLSNTLVEYKIKLGSNLYWKFHEIYLLAYLFLLIFG